MRKSMIMNFSGYKAYLISTIVDKIWTYFFIGFGYKAYLISTIVDYSCTRL
ncbi:hypothetical protein SAMN05444375_12121 [Segatella baroniae B14]|nr:hypothetical protein SAMN05444375_12121 [Segatella baroniae B14]